MPRFIIERQIKGAGSLTEQELAQIAETSNAVVASLGVPYTWVTTYVTADKMYCVHDADGVDAVVEHALRGGFPADVITEVVAEIGPRTAYLVTGAR
jgi:hypothetical protein